MARKSQSGAAAGKTNAIIPAVPFTPPVVKHVVVEPGTVIHEEQRKGERRQAQINAMAQFAPAPAAAPVAAPTAEELKLQAFQAAMTKLAEEHGQPIPSFTKPVVTRTARIQQNGVTRPADGTITGTVWAVADAITAAQNAPAAMSQMKTHPAMAADKMNDHTLKTQYAAWRKFNGFKGTVVALVQPVAVGVDAGLEAAIKK